MRQLVWLDSAVNDLVRLKSFIAKNNPKAAQLAAKTIQEATSLLKNQPNIGKPILELAHFRDLLIRFGAGGYILRYKILPESIYIVHVRHYREQDFIIKLPN